MKINFHIIPLENQSEIDRINLLMTDLILLMSLFLSSSTPFFVESFSFLKRLSKKL